MATRTGKLRGLVNTDRQSKNRRPEDQSTGREENSVGLSCFPLLGGDVPYIASQRGTFIIEFLAACSAINDAGDVGCRHPLRLFCTRRKKEASPKQEASEGIGNIHVFPTDGVSTLIQEKYGSQPYGE